MEALLLHVFCEQRLAFICSNHTCMSETVIRHVNQRQLLMWIYLFTELMLRLLFFILH